MLLCSKLDWQNWLFLEVTGLAKELTRSRGETSRSLSRLLQRGVIHRGPKVARSWTYQLDPDFGYKSRPADRAALKRRLSLVEGGSPTVLPDPVPGQMELPD